MKKRILIAMDNKKLIDKIIKKNLIYKNVQYREAILEILQRIKNINFILISEKIPGEISIEELIKKIKKINYKIIIIFVLDKEDIKKEKKLKKLGIKNIYVKNNKNFNKILNKLEENEIEKREKKNRLPTDKTRMDIKEKIIKTKEIKNSKFKNYIRKKDKKQNKKKLNKKNNFLENKIITIYGEKNSGKTTISNLLIYYLNNKNKKILIINLNKKTEKNYLILLGKKYYILKNKFKKNNISKNKIEILLKNSEIKVKKNISFMYEFSKIFYNKQETNLIEAKEKLEYFFKNYKYKYDYIIVDIGINKYTYVEEEFIRKSDKKVIVWHKNILGIKGIGEFIEKSEKKTENESRSLHIIQNKYYFNSISNLIIRNIFKKTVYIDKIFYSKNFKNLTNKISKNEKVKIKKLVKRKIEKIIK